MATRDWYQERLVAAQAAVVAIEAALATVRAGGVATYSLDTGQTRESVTRLDLKTLNADLASAEERVERLSAKLGSVTIGRPAF